LYDIGLAHFAQLLLIPGALDKLDSFFPLIKQAPFATSTHGPTTSSLDLASSISHPGGEIDISCGYRASSTRALGIDARKLRKAALAARLGDVDYRPHPDFIDVGRIRQWCLGCPASEIAGD
jgi:uncharacterized protein YcbK (DUF882 family)